MLYLDYHSFLATEKILILILKPNKPPENPVAYRSINLLTIILKKKNFKNILLKRLLYLADNANIISHTQFGFKARYFTIHQLHRTIDYNSNALAKNNTAPPFFLMSSRLSIKSGTTDFC